MALKGNEMELPQWNGKDTACPLVHCKKNNNQKTGVLLHTSRCVTGSIISTPPHSMTVFILTKITVLMIQHPFVTTVISVITIKISWNEEECNMILPATHLT